MHAFCVIFIARPRPWPHVLAASLTSLHVPRIQLNSFEICYCTPLYFPLSLSFCQRCVCFNPLWRENAEEADHWDISQLLPTRGQAYQMMWLPSHPGIVY